MERTGENYAERENAWDEAWPTTNDGEEEHSGLEPDNLDEELPFPDVVGTTDPIIAARDAEPYMPPTDPPVLPGGGQGIHVGTGFGESALEEAANDPLPRGDEDIHDEALLLLRQDSLTSTFPLDVEVNDGVIRLFGQIGSVDEAEHATWILGELKGVEDVIDDTEVTPDADRLSYQP